MPLKAGVAEVNITPPLGLEVSGYGFGRSRGVLDDLTASVLLLDTEEERVVIATSDLIGFDSDYVNRIRAGIENEVGVARDHVIVCASHTHSGPATMFLRKWGEIDEAYVKCLIAKLVGATIQASRNKAPASVASAKGRVDSISYNRIWRDGPIDPDVGILRVDDRTRLMALLMNFSCHPVNLHSYGNLISADFPGYARRLIQKLKGGVCVLYANGAGGDINPKGDINNPKFAERNGTILGCEALKTSEQMETTPQVRLRVKTRTAMVPLGSLPSREYLLMVRQDNATRAEDILRNDTRPLDDISRSVDIQNARLSIEWAEEALNELEKPQQKREEPIEIQAMAINDLVLVGIAAEPYVEIGLSLKKRSRFEDTFVIGYANGCAGYVPTKEAYAIGAYEATQRKVYRGTYPFTPDVGRIVEHTAVELVEDL